MRERWARWRRARELRAHERYIARRDREFGAALMRGHEFGERLRLARRERDERAEGR